MLGESDIDMSPGRQCARRMLRIRGHRVDVRLQEVIDGYYGGTGRCDGGHGDGLRESQVWRPNVLQSSVGSEWG